MAEELGIDDFLTHEQSGGGRSGSYLDNWKKRKVAPGEGGPHVDTWLHTRTSIISLWTFPWPRVVERSAKGVDPDDKSLEVWSGTFNSWEPPEVLKRQHFVDKNTGELESPPQLCPMARLVAAVRAAVREGKVNWVDALFEFVGDDPRKAVVLHAGGMYGAFGSKDLTPQQKTEMKKAGIFAKEAWKEKMTAQGKYLVQVCDNDDPGKGIQVATLNSLLGDKVKAVINDAMGPKSLGPEKGNPLKHPYCIQWQHLPDEQDFGKKYHAARLDGVKLTDEVRAVIVDGPPRDTARDVAPGNVVELRMSVEKHYVGPAGVLDFDDIFGPAEALLDKQATATATKQARAEVDKVMGNVGKRRALGRTVVSAEDAREAADEVDEQDDPQDPTDGDNPGYEPKLTPAEEVQAEAARTGEQVYDCDECGAPMLASQTVCKACGKDYAEDAAEPEPEPEPAPRPSRSSAAKAPQQAPKAAAAKPNGNGTTAARTPPAPFKSTPPAAGRRVKG